MAGIALIGLAISLQLEILFRVAERAEIRERYSRILEGVEDYPDLLGLTFEALDASVKTLETATIPQLRDEVINVFHHATSQLQELAQGRLRRTGSDNTLVLDRFEHTQHVVRGTTDEGDTSWWQTDDGKKFLKLNTGLIAKGVRIERVWILSKRPSRQLLDMFEEHHKLDIEVFVVRADRKDLDRRLLINFTLMDDDFLQMDVPNKEGQAVEYLYSENRVDVERALNTFAQLKSKATKYTGSDSLNEIFPRPRRTPAQRHEGGDAANGVGNRSRGNRSTLRTGRRGPAAKDPGPSGIPQNDGDNASAPAAQAGGSG